MGTGHEVVGQLFANLLRAGACGPVGEVALLRSGNAKRADEQAPCKGKSQFHHFLNPSRVDCSTAPF
jgi:hypothetical protein